MAKELSPKVRTSYRIILKQELADRCNRNPKYSLRAFARDLQLTPGRLSHILNGSQGMSRTSASAIAQCLNWNQSERDYFCDLVDLENGRSRVARESAGKRLVQNDRRYSGIEIDAFKVISDWHHFAILELTRVRGFQSDPKWIARALGISIHESLAAISRLKRLGCLEEKNGKYLLQGDFSVGSLAVPSESIRKFHKQILEKALRAIDFQTMDERDLSGMIIAICKKDLSKAKDVLKEFRRSFDQEFSAQSKNPDSLYCLGIQLFKLQETET